MSREDILTEIRTLLAGRCAEELVFNTQTSGAANDIEPRFWLSSSVASSWHRRSSAATSRSAAAKVSWAQFML